MFSTAVLRTARTAIHNPSASYFIRYSSTQQVLKPTRARADESQGPIRIISYEEMKARSERPAPNQCMIDVRTPEECLEGMIPTAFNLHVNHLSNALHASNASFKTEYGFDKPRKDQEVVIYCKKGIRSTIASELASRNGYTKILNYKGSWLDWIEQEKKAKAKAAL